VAIYTHVLTYFYKFLEQGGSESSGSSTGGGSGRKRNPAGTGGETGGGSEAGPSGKDNGKSGNEAPPQTPSSLAVTNKPFRVALLRAMSDQVCQCESALSLIPLLQVALVILSDLDGSTDAEIKVVEGLMRNLLDIMKMKVGYSSAYAALLFMNQAAYLKYFLELSSGRE
jgi:hypothetical protein